MDCDTNHENHLINEQIHRHVDKRCDYYVGIVGTFTFKELPTSGFSVETAAPKRHQNL